MVSQRNLPLRCTLLSLFYCLASQQVLAQHAASPSLATPAQPPQVIELLSATNGSGSWSWTGTVRFIPKPLGSLLVSGNLFGLSSASGSVDISASDRLNTTIHLDQIKANNYILGYPEVIYGYKPFGMPPSQLTPVLQLPLKLSSVPNLWLIADFSIDTRSDPSLALDCAYDLWLTKTPKPNDVHKGDIELMIWSYHRNLKPAGSPLDSSRVELTTWVNGQKTQMYWIAYLSGDSATPGSILVSFMPDQTPEDRADNPAFSSVNLGVNLRDVLTQLTRVVNSNIGWDTDSLQSLYLNDVELGTEFGTHADHAYFTWNLNRFRFVLGSPWSEPAGHR